jgi:hypothetical protein
MEFSLTLTQPKNYCFLSRSASASTKILKLKKFSENRGVISVVFSLSFQTIRNRSVFGSLRYMMVGCRYIYSFHHKGIKDKASKQWIFYLCLNWTNIERLESLVCIRILNSNRLKAVGKKKVYRNVKEN